MGRTIGILGIALGLCLSGTFGQDGGAKASEGGILILPTGPGTLDMQDVLHAELVLQQLGYDVGLADALITEETVLALRRWQADAGRTPDGILDADTLRGLDASLPESVGVAGSDHVAAAIIATVDTIEDALPPPAAGGPALPAAPVLEGTLPPAPPVFVYEAQKRLSQLGYVVGPIDGQPSLLLDQAVRDFQRRRGMAPTGQISDITIRELLQPMPQKDTTID